MKDTNIHPYNEPEDIEYCLEVKILHTDYDYDPECALFEKMEGLRFNIADINEYIEYHCGKDTKIVGNIMNDGYAEDIDNGTRLYFDETEV